MYLVIGECESWQDGLRRGLVVPDGYTTGSTACSTLAVGRPPPPAVPLRYVEVAMNAAAGVK